MKPLYSFDMQEKKGLYVTAVLGKACERVHRVRILKPKENSEGLLGMWLLYL